MRTQRDRVYKYVQNRKTGATRAEISRTLRISHPAVCRRVDELLDDRTLRVSQDTRRGAQVLVARHV